MADARQAILSKQRSGMVDARDKLVKMAKTGGDARKKLDKIRNLKAGKLEVKKRGGVTITTTTKGELLLTTKKKEAAEAARNSTAVTRGNFTRNVGRDGAVTGITTKKSKPPQHQQPRPSSQPLIRGSAVLNDSLRRDQELMNARVDPAVMERTLRRSQQSRPLSPRPYDSRGRSRTRSRSPPQGTAAENYRRHREERRNLPPMRQDRPGAARREYNDYDDPRRSAQEEDYRRGMIRQSSQGFYDRPRTMGDRIESSSAGSSAAFVSPLQGSKILVSNLQDSVTQEDITELFGDIGSLKRAKLVEPVRIYEIQTLKLFLKLLFSVPNQGVAEVVFVKHADAQRAVEIYHNRQLDGRPMKCKLASSGGGGGEGR